MGSECLGGGFLIYSGVFVSNFSVDLWGWATAEAEFREEVDLPVVEFEESACPPWSVISEVASKIDHFATVLCTFNFRGLSPAKVVLEEAPRAVGPTPISIHLENNWLGSSWDASAQWQRWVALVQIDWEGLNVERYEIEVNAEVEEFKGHHEPCIEVALKLDVGVELLNVLSSLWKLVFAESPVPTALDVPCKAGLPFSYEGGPSEGFCAWVDVFVWPDENVIERK